MGWYRWLGADGAFIGMETFGESGPYQDVYEHFGITAERIAEAAGLVPLHSVDASRADWDRYEWGLILNAERWAARHPDDEGADLLFRALASRVAGGRVYLDCPEPNAAATALATSYGLEPAFETARMYRGTDPQLPLERTFGITTFELGGTGLDESL